ncbi:MAG: hypothetical protein K2N26_01030 [Oscillospiraceae bacterium]|nr:hypothetical protein [Oscillospiraceae bacterium]MDE7278298.1 hypothetical protein [Oscillospiraceae bacterium]
MNNKPLLNLVDRKINEMERYSEITNRMLYEDIDGVGELLAERQSIITAMDGISLDIKQYISEQSIEHQDKLNRLMKFEDIGGLNGELLELQEKIDRVRELRKKILEDDAAAYDRLGKMREELRDKLEQSAKGKQVINYFSGTSINVNKGKKLNISN